MSEEELFLGFDSSTQSLKVSIVNKDLKLVYSYGINFDKDLSRFGTQSGVFKDEDGSIYQPPLLWVAAYDMIFEQMKKDCVHFENIKSMSISGQQHGSVYWKNNSLTILENLDVLKSLEDNLQNCFSINKSPIWMDSTTTIECKHLETVVGGPQQLANITGSRAYERFTGNQIAKIYTHHPQEYNNTERISLVSSFGACLLAGKYSNIDVSDGSGMNLLDIHTKQWCKECLDACAPELAVKLGDPVDSWEVTGPISSYYVNKYGVCEKCIVVSGSGDNNCSLTALGLINRGEVGVSLGTSNTFFGITNDPVPGLEGHIFVSPVDKEAFMCMLCYKNGDFVRSEVNKTVCGGDWDKYSNILKESKPGNNGYITMIFNEPEITPNITKSGSYIWDDQDRLIVNTDDESLDHVYPACKVRGVIEYQFMSMRIHSESIGIKSPSKLIATGGASNNKEILQILSDIFNCPVYTIKQSDSASLGAAFRALHGYICYTKQQYVPYVDILTNTYLSSFTLSNTPNIDAYNVYTQLLPRYMKHEIELM
ncbi:hypothetical protein WA158_005297 [Blastocystis sp. Blastoise]